MTTIYCTNNIGEEGYFDLFLGTKIAQSLKANDIGDLTSINFNFTDTILIPFTPNNNKLLRYINDEKGSSALPYTKILVRVEIDGVQTIPKGLGIVTVEPNGYSLAVISGAKTFFDSVGTKLLTDLSGLVHESSYSIVASNRNATTEIVYPAASYKTITNPVIDTTKPFVYYHTLIDRIITDAGYTKAGSIFSDSKYLKKICSCWGSAKGYQDSFVKERMASAFVGASQNIPMADDGVQHVVNFGNSFNQGTTPIGYWSANKYRVDEPGVPANWFMFACNVKVTITIFVIPGYTCNLQIVDGANNPVDVMATNVGSGTYTYDFVRLRTSVTGFTIDPPYAKNGVGNGIGVTAIYNSPAAGSTSIDITAGSIEIVPLEIPVIVNDALGVHSINYYAKLLPELQQLDLLKDFALNYGIIFTEKDNILTCTTVDEILTAGTIVDWTAKREPGVSDKINYNYTSYAQTNYFKYKAGDGYSNKDVGKGSFLIANDNLAVQKTIYESIFDNSSQIESNGGVFNSMFTPTDANYFGIYPKVNGAANVFKLALVRSKYSNESNITYINGVSYSDYFIAYFEDPRQGNSLDFDQDITTFYTKLVSALNRLRVINRLYNLTAEDIAAYSTLNRIYDNGSLYRINSIDNFIKGKSTNVQLIKII